MKGKFDSKLESFAQLTADNRLKIWDKPSGQASAEFTPQGEQASELTCLAWGKGVSSSSASKKKKAKQQAHVVGIGTVQGSIMVYDCLRSELQTSFGGPGSGHTARVNDLVFSSSGASIYSCSEDCSVICWNVGSGQVAWQMSTGKHPAKKLIVSANDDELITGGTTIKVYDLATRTVKKKLGGHASPVSSLIYSSDCTFILSAASDRFINLWDLSPDSNVTDPLRVFTLDSSPSHLCFAPFEEAEDLQLLAVSEAGAVGVWRFPAPPVSKKSKQRTKHEGPPLAPQCKISLSGGGGIFSAHFIDSEEVQLCRGSDIFPTFDTVKIAESGGDLKRKIELESAAEGSLLLGKSKKAKRKSLEVEPDVIGMSDMPINGMDRGGGDLDALGDHDDAGSLDDDETLEAKVKALGLDMDRQRSNANTEGTGFKADTMHAVLIQALDSEDKTLLQQCLNVTNPKVIHATVARLPPRSVAALLKKLAARFQSKPARSIALVSWIRAVLTQHTSLLMSQPDIVKSLTPLYQLVESRVATYHKLLKLEGRLELALTQVSNRSGGTGPVSKEPELVVDENVGDADDVVGAADDDMDDEFSDADDFDDEDMMEEDGEEDDMEDDDDGDDDSDGDGDDDDDDE